MLHGIWQRKIEAHDWDASTAAGRPNHSPSTSCHAHDNTQWYSEVALESIEHSGIAGLQCSVLAQSTKQSGLAG
eukprot:scaffold273804_cov30-Tisochrysis_lutea.AAC.1